MAQTTLPQRLLETSHGQIRLSVQKYKPRSKHQKFQVEIEGITPMSAHLWWMLYRIGASHHGALSAVCVPPSAAETRTWLWVQYAASAAAEAAFNQMVLWLSEGC